MQVLNAQGDEEVAMLDITIMRAHQYTAGAKKRAFLGRKHGAAARRSSPCWNKRESLARTEKNHARMTYTGIR